MKMGANLITVNGNTEITIITGLFTPTKSSSLNIRKKFGTMTYTLSLLQEVLDFLNL